MNNRHLADRLSRLSALDEPVRRELYLYVAGQADEVGRDQAAQSLGISRSLAAFHLDKLVKAGLLETTFRRLSRRRGPGAGRPSKLYRRARAALEVSVPERRYELAGRLMARALTAGDATPAGLQNAAREEGERLGAGAGGRARSAAATRMFELLRDAGFEPRRDRRGRITLANCPFEALACDSRELVCGMNLALVQGMVHGLGIPGVSAKLEPQPGMCCVAIVPEFTP